MARSIPLHSQILITQVTLTFAITCSVGLIDTSLRRDTLEQGIREQLQDQAYQALWTLEQGQTLTNSGPGIISYRTAETNVPPLGEIGSLKGGKLVMSSGTVDTISETVERGSLSVTAAQDARTLRQAQLELLLSNLKLLGLALTGNLLAGIGVARDLSRDFRDLARAAQRVSQGQRNVNVPMNGVSNEAQATALAFNQMLRNQEEQIARHARFMTAAAHELRTPVTALRGHAGLLERRWQGLDDSTRQEIISTLSRESVRLSNLISDMLALHRDEPLEVSSTNLDQLVGELKALTKLTLDIGPLGHANTNAGALRQILLNLIQNAERADASSVQLSRVADTIWVTDNGTGIAPENHSVIFTPLWRADHARARDGGGAGLGLTLSRELAQRMGAQLQLHDSAQRSATQAGQTRFTLQLSGTPGPVTRNS